MFRDIEMNDTATIVTEHDEDEQNPEGSSRQRKEVDGHQVLHMVIEKAPPGLGRWLAMANRVLGNGGLGNGNAKLYKFAVHAESFFKEDWRDSCPGSTRVLRARRVGVRHDLVDSSTSNIVGTRSGAT